MQMTHILLTAILVVLALGVGFYIGSDSNDDLILTDGEGLPTTSTTDNTSDAGSQIREGGQPPSAGSTTTIATDRLTDGQKRVLGLLGVDADTLTITPAMEACAREAIGETRLQEIIAGDTPSLGEGADLLQCYQLDTDYFYFSNFSA